MKKRRVKEKSVEYPKELIKAFKRTIKADFTDEEYSKYETLAKEYLKTDDRFELCRLAVSLSRVVKNGKKEEEAEKLDCGLDLVSRT